MGNVLDLGSHPWFIELVDKIMTFEWSYISIFLGFLPYFLIFWFVMWLVRYLFSKLVHFTRLKVSRWQWSWLLSSYYNPSKFIDGEIMESWYKIQQKEQLESRKHALETYWKLWHTWNAFSPHKTTILDMTGARVWKWWEEKQMQEYLDNIYREKHPEQV